MRGSCRRETGPSKNNQRLMSVEKILFGRKRERVWWWVHGKTSRDGTTRGDVGVTTPVEQDTFGPWGERLRITPLGKRRGNCRTQGPDKLNVKTPSSGYTRKEHTHNTHPPFHITWLRKEVEYLNRHKKFDSVWVSIIKSTRGRRTKHRNSGERPMGGRFGGPPDTLVGQKTFRGAEQGGP